MIVRYFATLRKITGVHAARLNEPVHTLGELLRKLAATYGEQFRNWVLDGDELGKHIIILINGRDARHLGGINTALQPDDTVSIFPAIAGG